MLSNHPVHKHADKLKLDKDLKEGTKPVIEHNYNYIQQVMLQPMKCNQTLYWTHILNVSEKHLMSVKLHLVS